MGVLDGALERARVARDKLAEIRKASAEKAVLKRQARDARELEHAIAAQSAVYVLGRQYPIAAHLVAWVATSAVVYFLWLYCLDEARDVSIAMLLSRVGFWRGHVEFSFPLLLAFVLISAAIALYCKYWVAFFVSMSWKSEPWGKGIALFLGVLTSALVVLGSFSLTQGGRIEGHRSEAVQEQRATSNRAALNADLQAIERDLADARGPDTLARPSTQMQACRNTESTWRIRISQTPADDPQRPAIVRAIADAIRCDQLRAARAAKMREIAALPVEAQVAGRVVVARDRDVAGAVDTARNVRGALLAATTDLLAILAALIAICLERIRQRQLAARAAVMATSAPATSPADEPAPATPAAEPDDLELVPLADWRNEPDPEFTRAGFMVDEHGRRLKRVGAHYRVDDDRAPKASPRDTRRAADPAPADEPIDDDADADAGVIDRLMQNAAAAPADESEAV